MIQTLLFVSGINTLLQVFFGTRLPVIVGGSHTFVLPTISIILCGRYSYIINPHEVNFSLITFLINPNNTLIIILFRGL